MKDQRGYDLTPAAERDRVADIRETLQRAKGRDAKEPPKLEPSRRGEPGSEVTVSDPRKPKLDPLHPADAAVNRQPTMTYAEAMKAQQERRLVKAVLTERGLVMPVYEPRATRGVRP